MAVVVAVVLDGDSGEITIAGMSFTRFFRIIVVAGLLANTVQSQNLEPAAGKKAPAKPRDPALIEIADVPGLPRVLLIGDSISMGYTLPVREKLKGRANVHHPPENCGPTERGLERLEKWLESGHWDVIHFNFGLHDLKYLDEKGQYVGPDKGKQVAPPEVYRKQLREITVQLQKSGAKLIYATTTPVPPGTTGRVAGDERVYNEIATAVMKELKVPIDDLCGLVAAQQTKLPPRPESEKPTGRTRVQSRPGELQLPFNVHFTPEGYDQLANLVVASVEKQLRAPVK